MNIAPELIDADADKVVRRLSQGGFQAYLVGGCVRDLLLNRNPKDFDVSSSATPAEIKGLFRNCRIIGRRFRLAHIFFGSKIIETATFRANPRGDDGEAEGELLIHRDNVWGTDTEDAQRRDFTINGLFYDVEEEVVIDHVNGLEDLRKRLIRTIGDPGIRFREDPVRMLRAIKFAARLGFQVEDATYRALVRHRSEIGKCSQPRVLEELYRLLRGGASRGSLELLAKTGVASVLSHHLASLYGARSDRDLDQEFAEESSAEENKSETKGGNKHKTNSEKDWSAVWDEQAEEPEHEYLTPFTPSFAGDDYDASARLELAWNILGQLDRHVAEEGETSNGLALACALAAFVCPDIVDPEVRAPEASEMVHEVLDPLISEIGITRRDAESSAQILLAQKRLAPTQRKRGKPMAFVRRDYFSDALVLYELLASAEGKPAPDLSFWKNLQGEVGAKKGNRERKRRRGGRRRQRSA